MLAHRSIRSYTDRTVSDEDLNSIIRAVQAAPNWVNLQLVSIIAVKNTDHRRRLAELCGNQVHIAEAPVFLVFCTDYHRVALACHKKEQTLDEVMQDIDTLLVGAHEVGIALEAGLKPRFPQQAVFFEETYKTDLKDKLAEYDVIYAHYLKERPWNNRVGNWTDLAADFYRHPFHYKGVADALSQQGFTSAKSRYSV